MATVPRIELQHTQSDQSNIHDPASYARAVDDYAKITHEQSLYPGQRFEALVQFLKSPRDQQHLSPIPSGEIYPSNRVNLAHSEKPGLQQPHESSATHYALAGGQRAEAKHLIRPEELEAVTKSCLQERIGQLLILRGYPSPAWLCTIGALYDVDPEFFRRHLDFFTTFDGHSTQDGPSKLPSSSTNIFQFRMPTIGSYIGPLRQRGGAQSLTGLRNVAQASMTNYLHKLRIGTGWRTGDSLLRQYNVHDMDQFSIEQAVTIYFSRLRPSPDHWIVIVFLDSGADPSLCQWPDSALPARHFPFPHQKRSLALKPDLWKDENENMLQLNTSDASWKGPSHRAQSVSRLHLRYGRFLRPDIMHQDPFYTLSELFSVLSYAESQVLDVIEVGLERDSWQAIQDDDLEEGARSRRATEAQNNLVHARQMLEARISNLSSVLEFVERHLRLSDLHTFWPHPADLRQQRESDATVKALQLDFDHLHRRAGALYSRCESAMTLVMNRASIAEAKRSIHQGHILSRFTKLAFVFVPATATAGIFGMNFRELGTGKLSIWMFFAVAVPLFFVSFMFLYGGWRRSWAAAKCFYQSRVKKVKENEL